MRTKIHEFDAERIYKEFNPKYDGMDLTLVTDWFIDMGFESIIENNTVYLVKK